MEQTETKVTSCVNEDEDCSWSGEDGCLCYPDDEKWVPVVKDAEGKLSLANYRDHDPDSETVFYLPRTVKVLRGAQVKEVPIETVIEMDIQVPDTFGEEDPKDKEIEERMGWKPAQTRLSGEMPVVNAEDTDYYLSSSKGAPSLAQRVEAAEGLAKLNAIVDAEQAAYERRERRRIAVFNEDSGVFEMQPLEEVMIKVEMFKEEEDPTLTDMKSRMEKALKKADW
jgi:hypothetical protein